MSTDDVKRGGAGGTLYVCATPIGNLEDITLRALRILGSVDVIAAEDTRRTRQLLSAHELATPLISLHEHNETARIPRILELLAEGRDVALVSDAGTPGISDPGQRVIQACIETGHRVVPVPGPTAFVPALIASGLPTDEFVFVGFLPRESKKRRERLQGLAGYPQTLIFYEAPHRLRRTLEDMLAVWQDRRAALARELTKVYEEFVRGRLTDLLAWCQKEPLRGEFVLIVAGAESGETKHDTQVTEDELRERLKSLLRGGMSRRDAVRTVSSELGVPKRFVYDMALRLDQDE